MRNFVRIFALSKSVVPEAWVEAFPTCNVTNQQSPVDIETVNVIWGSTPLPLYVSIASTTNATITIKNNGHTGSPAELESIRIDIDFFSQWPPAETDSLLDTWPAVISRLADPMSWIASISIGEPRVREVRRVA